MTHEVWSVIQAEPRWLAIIEVLGTVYLSRASLPSRAETCDRGGDKYTVPETEEISILSPKPANLKDCRPK